MPDQLLNVIVNLINRTKDGFNEIKKDLGELSDKFSDLNSVVRTSISALTAYTGAKGLMGLVKASENARLQLAQTSYFLRRMGGDVEGNKERLIVWGREMQKLTGYSDEWATTIAARVAPRFKDLNKAMEFGKALLLGQRRGLLDAESASIMMMKAVEGNTRALTWLAYQMGIIIDESVGLDSAIATIIDALTEGQNELQGFSLQWDRLKNNIGNLLEKAGTPLVKFFADILEKINLLIENVPILGKIFAVVAPIITTALASMGLASFIDTLFGISVALNISKLAFVGWAGAIGALLIGLVFWFDYVKKNWEDNRETVQIVAGAIIAALTTIGLFMGSWLIVIAGLLSLLVLFFISAKDKILEAWGKFKEGWKEYWDGINIILIETWEKIKNWFENNIVRWFEDKYNWIKNKIDEIKSWVSGVGEKIKNFGGSITGGILGAKQLGGYIPETGAYLLHKGEYVIPAGRGGAGAINITITGNTFLDEESAVKMGDLIIKVLQRNIRL